MPSISGMKDTSSVSLTYQSLKREKFLVSAMDGWMMLSHKGKFGGSF